jgi:biopolymer transport protein ExbB
MACFRLKYCLSSVFAALSLAFVGLSARAAEAPEDGGEKAPWWDAAWQVRKKIVITPGPDQAPVTDAVTLLRLHSGNFQFANAKDDGSDLRLIAEDGETVLAHHIERYDALMNEAFVWVKVPEVKLGGPTAIWLYSGNPSAPAYDKKPEETFPASSALVYHFTEMNAVARDWSGKGNAPEAATTATAGALVGPGIVLFGTTGITIPNTESIAWTAGGEVTVSVWAKPSAKGPNAILFRREQAPNALRIGLDNGVPFVEIADGAGTTRSAPAEAIAEGGWKHIAVVCSAGKTDLFVDGKPQGTVAKGIPTLTTAIVIGSTPELGGGFAGELDELRIHSAALPAPAIRFGAVSQSGSAESQKLVALMEDESSGGGGGGHNETLEHMMLFGDIAKNMMFDGWVAIGICIIMMVTGGFVAVKKFFYLNSIQKGTDAFMKQWGRISDDLTSLDHQDEASIKSMGGKASPKMLKHIRRSPLYHLYHIGAQEIAKRIVEGKSSGLSTRSMQAIRSSLDSGLVRENHKMNDGLIFLTISIAGGPYVGLLGTVVGVMITFALIAKTGEVEVNSIAPGIASALLATVFGLLVAIPALFIYSYLSTRIKDLLSSMQMFIDEFIAKMAEVYPPAGESGLSPTPATELKDPEPPAPVAPRQGTTKADAKPKDSPLLTTPPLEGHAS